MSADELPNPPRKTSWKRWTLALTTLAALALIALFLKPPTPLVAMLRVFMQTPDKFYLCLRLRVRHWLWVRFNLWWTSGEKRFCQGSI